MPIAANILQPLTDAEEWVLEGLHGMGLTWGLAIGLTLLTRFVMLPLIVRQYRSQREMKRHMPELRALQAKYKGGDKQKLQQEMSAYYREHGINPLASVGPMLLQIPVFISLYMLLRHDATNGLLGDGGFLFIPDLTAKPTGGVLVAMLTIYVCSQLASSAIATRTMQTSHRGFAMALPVLFAGVIARFPAGLAIYSITTSLWSLGQQVTFWRLSAAVPGPRPWRLSSRTSPRGGEGLEAGGGARAATTTSRIRSSATATATAATAARAATAATATGPRRRSRRSRSTREARRRSAAARAARSLRRIAPPDSVRPRASPERP